MMLGWEMRPTGGLGRVMTDIPEDFVEMLAVIQNDECGKQRLDTGWKFGAANSIKQKISPNFVT